MKRNYKITEQSLGAFMAKNYLASTAVVGESEHGIMIQNGSKVQTIPKNNIESWCLNNGLVEGMGTDAMSDMDKAIYAGNRARNKGVVAEQTAKANTLKDENLQSYHNQKKETILSNAMHGANMKNSDDGTDLSKVALGNKSYSKNNPGSNQ